jgi:hypothetical protein
VRGDRSGRRLRTLRDGGIRGEHRIGVPLGRGVRTGPRVDDAILGRDDLARIRGVHLQRLGQFLDRTSTWPPEVTILRLAASTSFARGGHPLGRVVAEFAAEV